MYISENLTDIFKEFEFLETEFFNDLKSNSILKSIEPKTEILAMGQNVRYIPIVLSGTLRVYGMPEEKELLYYFIKPGQTCIMTFSTIFGDQISKVFAISEEYTEVLLLPVAHVLKWIVRYP